VGQQQSIEQSFSPIEGFLLNGDIIWQPTQATKVEFIARSEIDETTLVDSFGAVDHYYELSLQHVFWRYLVLGTYVSYEIADYVDDPLVDQRLKEGLTGGNTTSTRISRFMPATSTRISFRPTKAAISSRTRCGSACASGIEPNMRARATPRVAAAALTIHSPIKEGAVKLW
jgi:hypothetical protein